MSPMCWILPTADIYCITIGKMLHLNWLCATVIYSTYFLFKEPIHGGVMITSSLLLQIYSLSPAVFCNNFVALCCR